MTAAPIHMAGERLMLDPAGALFWPARRTLIVSDLHLEKGSAAATRGSLLPPWDTRVTLDRLAALIRHWRPEQVVALGDSFHDRGGAGRLQPIDQARLVAMTRATRFIWVLGNHDPLPPEGMGGESLTEWREGKLLFRHEGKAGADAGEVCGHHHPKAHIPARGAVVTRPCFVFDGHRLMLPALGAYTGGLDVRDPAIRTCFRGRASVPARPAAPLQLRARRRRGHSPHGRVRHPNPEPVVYEGDVKFRPDRFGAGHPVAPSRASAARQPGTPRGRGGRGGLSCPCSCWTTRRRAPGPPAGRAGGGCITAWCASPPISRGWARRWCCGAGRFAEIIPRLAAETGAVAVHAGQPTEPWARRAMAEIGRALGARLHLHRTTTLFEPDSIRTQSGGPYGVFTPYSRTCLSRGTPEPPLPAPRRIPGAEAASDALDSWRLLPTKPDWAGGLRTQWSPGEAGAARRLDAFARDVVKSYDQTRNLPAVAGTSALSPHLHWGEISAGQVWHAVSQHGDGPGVTTYIAELLWREFSAICSGTTPTCPNNRCAASSRPCPGGAIRAG